jgi:uncharacterized OsmC-like protein
MEVLVVREEINGIDATALRRFASNVSESPKQGIAAFRVASAWRGGTLSEAQIDSWELAGAPKSQPNFLLRIDEPNELLGQNTAPNPQQVLLAALNACIIVGFVAVAALERITIEKLTISTEGTLDLRGFLGLDHSVKPGYEELLYTICVKGDGTAEQFERIHDVVVRTSPNRWNLTNCIKLKSTLVVE